MNTGQLEIIANAEVTDRTDEDKLVVYYGFGCTQLKTWLIHKHNKLPAPIAVLLLKLGCKYSSRPITHHGAPEVGDVVSTSDGKIVEVKTVEWI